MNLPNFAANEAEILKKTDAVSRQSRFIIEAW